MLIQFMLILAVVIALVVVIRGGHVVHVQASKRIGLIVFVLLNIYAVLRPDDLTFVAHLVGVGRGTDLVLYGLAIAFMFGMVNFYMRFRQVDRRLTALARQLALQEAETTNPTRLSNLANGSNAVELSSSAVPSAAGTADEAG